MQYLHGSASALRYMTAAAAVAARKTENYTSAKDANETLAEFAAKRHRLPLPRQRQQRRRRVRACPACVPSFIASARACSNG
jgi:hypothetical protein